MPVARADVPVLCAVRRAEDVDEPGEPRRVVDTEEDVTDAARTRHHDLHLTGDDVLDETEGVRSCPAVPDKPMVLLEGVDGVLDVVVVHTVHGAGVVPERDEILLKGLDILALVARSEHAVVGDERAIERLAVEALISPSKARVEPSK